MKPIPAIDENGEWIDVSIVGGVNVTLLALGGAYCIVVDPDGNPFRLPSHLIADLPAVRERVERTRKALENALQYAANVIQQDIAAQHGVCARPKRPSFAEALEAEFRTYKPSAPLWAGEIEACIKRARAASGE